MNGAKMQTRSSKQGLRGALPAAAAAARAPGINIPGGFAYRNALRTLPRRRDHRGRDAPRPRDVYLSGPSESRIPPLASNSIVAPGPGPAALEGPLPAPHSKPSRLDSIVQSSRSRRILPLRPRLRPGPRRNPGRYVRASKLFIVNQKSRDAKRKRKKEELKRPNNSADSCLTIQSQNVVKASTIITTTTIISIDPRGAIPTLVDRGPGTTDDQGLLMI
ncbi:hypothetical protein EVAR_94822_1 [Eumeta japonica]|uniref:Uncharacterized protein n=1 Tax=Eumeta variegata TaxID=151549 RepID=A0A4C1UIK2_EUMVA|nr:hypothetical protein EVAR_94822_1 [Eumeta japonica]